MRRLRRAAATALKPRRKLVIEGKGQKYMDQIRDIISKFNLAEEQRLKNLMDLSITNMKRLYGIIVFGTLGALVALLAGGWCLSRNISRPLAEMTAASERIASGELAIQFNTDRRSDEAGILRAAFVRMNEDSSRWPGVARRIAAGDLSGEVKPQSERDELGTAFAGMQHNLRDVMRQTLEAVNVLSSAASEISASVSQVAAGAAQTSAAIAETTATVEEVKKTAELNSDKVRQVSESAQRAAQTSDQGRLSVEGTTTGMNRIRQQMDCDWSEHDALERADAGHWGDYRHGERSGRAVEYPGGECVDRSGEGRRTREGFLRWWRRRVRSLAEQSKQATTQVRTILSEIQKATSGAMMATEQGARR